MAEAGLPNPEYRTVEFMVYATLKSHKWEETHTIITDTPQVTPQVNKKELTALLAFCTVPRSQKEMQEHIGLSDRKHSRQTKQPEPKVYKNLIAYNPSHTHKALRWRAFLFSIL